MEQTLQEDLIMVHFLKTILRIKKSEVITRKYKSHEVSKVRKALSEGFKAVWNGVVWVLTKIVYV